MLAFRYYLLFTLWSIFANVKNVIEGMLEIKVNYTLK